MNVYQRVSRWNSLRYDRVLDKPLLIALLREEYREWCTAEKPVDNLDGLCDTIYVAMGGVWKNKNDHLSELIQSRVDPFLTVLQEEPNPAFGIAMILDSYEFGDLDTDHACFMIIGLAGMQITRMGVEVDKAMLVVCDANDSKTIKKTASNVKANIDKGANFVAPEKRLQELLDEV